MPIPHFDLHTLGWKAFEDLAACIFGNILGQTIQTFTAGPDGGRDASFEGLWKNNSSGETYSGKFCIQCKHTSKPAKAFNIKILDGELPKIERLVKAGRCDTYLLITNHSLSAAVAAQTESKISAVGVKQVGIFGSEWINQMIAQNPRLRRLVPRIYGLGDLTQIITNQAYSQAKTVLESIAPDLGCFVPTSAYRKCAHALQEHGFVLLIGEPASGKTTIANLMALSAADEWKLQTLIISTPSDFTRLWDPNDPGQFLWVDDAFGATQYEAGRSSEWNAVLVKLKAAIKSGARVVFTSRDYIFAAAKNDLKLSSFELFDDSRVLIKVEELTSSEREMILYNHLKAGSQTKHFKSQVKGHLRKAAMVPKFLPEISRRFSHPKFTQSMPINESCILKFFAEPVQVLFDVVKSLAAAEKAALGLVFIAAGKLPIPLDMDSAVAEVLDLLGVTVGEVKAALAGLDDSLLKRTDDGASEYWTFRHPTIRDAYATMVGSNPELIDVYLAGVSTEKMFEEVVCGVGSLQGAKIKVPQNRYPVVLQRLNDYSPPLGSWQDPKIIFLNTRCSVELIRLYLGEKSPIECIPFSIARWDNGLGVLAKLNEGGYLPPLEREMLAKGIITYCERDESCSSLDSTVFRNILTSAEYTLLLDKIGSYIIDNAEELIADIKDDWDEETDPADAFYDLTQSLSFIRWNDNFSDEQRSEAETLCDLIERTEHELKLRYVETPYEKLDTEDAAQGSSHDGRSIFEDVDE